MMWLSEDQSPGENKLDENKICSYLSSKCNSLQIGSHLVCDFVYYS